MIKITYKDLSADGPVEECRDPFVKKFGFDVVDTTDNGYELLALSFDGTMPKFARNVKNKEIESKELTIYYDMQCPYISKHRDDKTVLRNEQRSSMFNSSGYAAKSKGIAFVFNNWGVFYKGTFETVNLLDDAYLERILKKT